MQNFVGIFDSGVGGLTVLKSLQQVAPSCNFVYVADHAFCPYGTKSFEQIQKRVVAVSKFLQRLGAVQIVVACNTASVFAPQIRKLALPVFDVISTTCAYVSVQRCKSAILLATQATVQSGVYQRVLGALGVKVFPFACSEFVPLVENLASARERQQTVQRCLQNARNVRADEVVLGCTHFPLLQGEISRCLGRTVVSCSQSVAPFFEKNYPKGCGKTLFFSTGDCVLANKAAQWCGAKFLHVDI